MAVHRWHVGPIEDRPSEGVLIAQVFSVWDTPTGNNVAGVAYTTIMGDPPGFGMGQVPPAWVALDPSDAADLAAGTLFGKTYAIRLDRDLTNAQKQTRLNNLWTDNQADEQASITTTYEFFGYKEPTA